MARALALYVFSILQVSVNCAKEVYSITPKRGVIEYRYAFARKYKKQVKENYGYKDSFFKYEEVVEKEETKHFPAGLYYVGTDIRYDIALGRNIVYSVVDSPDGNRRLFIWEEVPTIDADTMAEHVEKAYDQKIACTSIGALIGWATGLFCAEKNKEGAMITTAFTLVGGGLGSLISSPYYQQLTNRIYLSEAARADLMKEMAAANDNRSNHIKLNDRTYIKLCVLRSTDPSIPGVPHINDFVIEKASRHQIKEVVKGNYEENGMLGFTVEAHGFTYDEKSIKERLTVVASLKRLLGLKASNKKAVQKQYWDLH